jgi:ABC-type transporter Mla subunit MlaD
MSRRVRVPDTDIASPRRELTLGVLVLLLVAVIAYLSTTALSGSPFSSHYEVRMPLPADGPVLRDGDPVRVAGRRAGQVRHVEVAADGRTGVATLTLTDGKVGPGAGARVRLKGLAGSTYVELQRGDTRRPLPSGATLAAARVHGAPQLSDVVAAFDRQTRGALARTITATGTALGGRGTELNRTLATLPDALTRATPLLRALVPERGAVSGLVDAVDRVADAAAPAGSTALGDLLPAARAVLQATGAASGDLGATLAALPAAERQLARTLPRADALLDDVRAAAVRLRPGVDALRTALPAVLRVEDRRAGLGRLAALGRTATPVVRATLPVVLQLRGSATALSAVATPVAKLSTDLVPYRKELVEAPAGFTRWGDFVYQDGQAKGHRAVRFSMVFTCAHRRNPYPAAGTAQADRELCR